MTQIPIVERLAAAIDHLAHGADRAAEPMRVEAWEIPGEPVPTAQALGQARFAPAEVGQEWGPTWGTTWFRLSGEVPRAWEGETVEVRVDLGYSGWGPGFQAEGLVVDRDGRPVRGLHPRQQRHRVADRARAGEPVELLVEAAANPSIRSITRGGAADMVGDGSPIYRLARAELVVPDEDARALAIDLDVLRTLLLVAGQAGTSQERVREVEEACRAAIDHVDEGRLADARAAVAPALAAPAAADAPRLSLVGHAHLDTAWLWPIRETVRKAVRTYANVMRLMEADETLTFAGSQALHHAWVRDLHPDLWQQVVARAADGRWVPVGGMWVESDVLLASGESLARQLVHGQRFFEEHLGRAARIGWLPDCFGFTPALPQLLRQAGIDSFLTQKLSWNEVNRFPHSTFWWEGLDGSRVLAHFPTVDTYNAELSGNDLQRATRSDPGGRRRDDSLAPVGFGDGGGGPTREMVERAQRMRDVDGLPRASFTDPDTFFARLRDGTQWPTWRGDLYLETHRGVWTSQRETKLGDARCDEALREAETWCATATLKLGADYPYDELDALWKRHLVLEFHDILPGTSIARVHREAEAEHAEVLRAALALRDRALAALGGRPRQPEPAAAAAVGGVRPTLDNGLLRVEFDADGHPVSVRDLVADRELVPPGERLGVLHLHEDLPGGFDAWNLDRPYLSARTDITDSTSVRADEEGVTVTRAFGSSRVALTWSLPAGEPRLDLVVEADWRESERALKLSLPFDLRCHHETAGIQLGLVERPLHENTTWEQARFEEWFHGFVHLAEGDYGVAAVTADAHGYDSAARVRDDGGTTTEVRLTLLRAPSFPDPDCDRGRHMMRVSLHAGVGTDAAMGAGLRARAALVPPAADAGLVPAVVVGGPGVRVTAVKMADDRSGDLVVRLHESQGGRATAEIRAARPIEGAARCDLLEHPSGEPLGCDGSVAVLPLRPFELATLRLRMA